MAGSSFEPYRHELPTDVAKGLPDNFPGVKEFLEDKVRNDKHGSSMVQDVFKRYLILNCPKSRKKWKNKPRISAKELTAREKRSLGLDRLPKTGLQYTNFTELSTLWQDYMKDLLGTEVLKATKWTPPSDYNDTSGHLPNLQSKVSKADLHGAIIKVESAECPTHVGRQGICLMETRHTFQIISTDNKLRMMPKKGSVFSVEVDGFRFSFPGSNVMSRPAERSTKKPKNRPPMEF